MLSADGSAIAAIGQTRMPTAREKNLRDARARLRKELKDILYLGALTGRQKATQAGTRPDQSRRQFMNELQTWSLQTSQLRIDGTGKPAVRRSRRESQVHPCHSCRAVGSPAIGRFRTADPRSETSR